MKLINANADSCANCFSEKNLNECLDCSMVYCDDCWDGEGCPDCGEEMEQIEDTFEED